MSFLWKYFKKGWALEWRDDLSFIDKIFAMIIITSPFILIIFYF